MVSPEQSISITPFQKNYYKYDFGSPIISPDKVVGGVKVALLTSEGETLHTATVMERGRFLPRPFYERRIERAVNRAERLAGVLAVTDQVEQSNMSEEE